MAATVTAIASHIPIPTRYQHVTIFTPLVDFARHCAALRCIAGVAAVSGAGGSVDGDVGRLEARRRLSGQAWVSYAKPDPGHEL